MANRRANVFLALLLVLFCWTGAGLAAGRDSRPALTQVGVIDALLAGGFTGSYPVGGLRRLGDFGLGTFDALDGEMALLDGVVYQIPASGAVRRAPDSLTTPFAQVLRFKPEGAVALPPAASLQDLEAALDSRLGDANVFAAARVDAGFASLTARSVPRQTPPYRTLAEAAKEQSVFRFAKVQGTLIGLRGPAFARGLGVPGWHWHFLTSDRARGGHVLDCVLASGAEAAFMTLRRLEVLLPEGGLSGLDLAKDRTDELKAVESAPEKIR